MSMEKMPMENAPTEESTTQEETSQESYESAFVPSERLNEFDQIAEIGDSNDQLAEQLREKEQEKQEEVEHRLALAGTAALAGSAFTAFGGPIGPFAGAPALVFGAAMGISAKKKMNELDQIRGEKSETEEARDEAYDKTRGIVEEELRKGGAYDMAGDQLHVTPEQIEIAKKEGKDIEK